MSNRSPFIALDFSSKEECLSFLKQFEGKSLNVKVGMELFYLTGSDFLSELIKEGHQVFLDLKLHDIPNTVERAMKVIASLGVSMVTIHASGGSTMIAAARRGLDSGSSGLSVRPKLLAVTQLTSTSDKQVKKEQLVSVSLEQSVLNYAKIAIENGADGIVCSPKEVKMIRKAISDKQMIIVTPGIRSKENQGKDDQTRVVTPHEAAEIGSTYIVVGRPITQAEDSIVAYRNISREFLGEEL